jgi:hypothetical protein
MELKKEVHVFQRKLFDIITVVTYILYILIFTGLSFNAPNYLHLLNAAFTIYVSIFLLYRFNPFRDVPLTELDKKMIFTAAIFLFTTTTVNSILSYYIQNYVNKTKEFAKQVF